jgi:hypothetical protein
MVRARVALWRWMFHKYAIKLRDRLVIMKPDNPEMQEKNRIK